MEDADPRRLQAPPSSSDPNLVRLQEILSSCSQSVDNGDTSQAQVSMAELAECLDAVSAASASDPDDEDVQRTSAAMLTVIIEHVASSSTDQEVVDALSFELPKAVCKFSGASSRYLSIVDRIIDQLVLRCHPRDMFSILCELDKKLCQALDYQNKEIKVSGYASPLLSGLAKVFISIQRSYLKHLKVAVPLIFRALEQSSLEEDEDKPLVDLFDRAIGFGSSIHSVCQKLEDEASKKTQALLDLYILQIMTYVSVGINNEVPGCLHLVSELTRFLQCCNFSYIELITGSAVDQMSSIIPRENDEDDTMSCFTYVKHGACLSVIWSCIINEIEEEGVANELRHSQSKRWQAIGMLKHIFSSANIPWRFKKHAIDFLHEITVGDPSQGYDDENSDILDDSLSSIFAALQGIKMVVIHSPNAEQRRKAFDALKRVLADIPVSQRLDMLKALIRHSNSSSMTALLLDCVREEMRREIHQKPKDAESPPEKPFWTDNVFELINFILRPSIREDHHPSPRKVMRNMTSRCFLLQALSALNLYRFILITESTGKTNYTEVLSETNLRKAHTEWLLPLRNLVIGMAAENKNEAQSLDDMVCALYPLEMVVHRCIELVEKNLKNKLQS